MLDYNDFLSQDKSMLIAPAGFGKTYTIAECLKHTQKLGRQLILTHTHAGVSSIKEKIKKEKISYSNYNVETITSFAQKYVFAFYTGPYDYKQEDGKLYYKFIIQKAIDLFKRNPIRQTICNSYKGLFVDEYQDCTIKQHELILLLSEVLQTRILGDPLQGIFGFNGDQLIDMKYLKDEKVFAKFELDKPQRWLHGNNSILGEQLKNIRCLLENNQNIHLENYHDSIEVCLMKKKDEFFDCKIKDENGDLKTNILNKRIWDLKKESSLLILYPNSQKNIIKSSRELFIKIFGDDFKMLEAIDDKLFYEFANSIDNAKVNEIEKVIKSILVKCYTKKGIDHWFNNSNLNTEELLLFTPILNNLKKLELAKDYKLLADTFTLLHKLKNMKCIRKEIIHSLISAIQNSYIEKCTVYESMIKHRNSIRRIGRKVAGKYVGTTLLTKGLEFDTVAIMNANEFDCPKHLYVAMTRASKQLIIFTTNSTLKPYKLNLIQVTTK